MKFSYSFLSIHLMLSLLLFNAFEQKSSTNIKKESVLYSASKEHRTITSTKNWEYSLLFIAYITGERKNLSTFLRKTHKRLYLGHLFTPSALHFGAILLIITPFIKLMAKKRSYQRVLLLAVYFTAYLLLPTLYSIHRVALYKILQLFNKKNIHQYYIFIATFIVDFFWGNFENSPKSFLYSFLFFGLITTLSKINFFKVFIVILLGQLFLSAYFHTSFQPPYFLYGFIYTSIFSIIFPIFVIFYLFPINIFSPLIIFLFNIFSFILNNIPDFTFSINASMLSLFLSVIFLNLRNRYSRLLIIVIVTLFSCDLLNFPSRKYLTYSKSKALPGPIKKIVRTSKGFKTTHSKKLCYHTLYNYNYKIFCRKI